MVGALCNNKLFTQCLRSTQNIDLELLAIETILAESCNVKLTLYL